MKERGAPGAIEALQRVEAFMAQRQRLLAEVARTDEDFRPIASNGPEDVTKEGLRLEAADVYALMSWADRGISAAMEEIDAHVKPEKESEEMMVIVTEGIPVIVPLEIPGDERVAGGVETSMKTAERLAASGGQYVVMVVPADSVRGGMVFRREVVKESLGDIIGQRGKVNG